MERLNLWLSATASVGVILGIIFLAYEIRVNTDAVKAESAATYATMIVEARTLDPEYGTMSARIAAEGWASVPPDLSRATLVKIFQP